MTQHIVIVGGGIIGVSTAFFLSQHEQVRNGSFKVSIVEANAIASGASGKAGGFLSLDWHSLKTASLAQLSYTLYQALAQKFDGKNTFGYGNVPSFSLKKKGESTQDTVAEHIRQFRPHPPAIEPATYKWATGWLEDDRVLSLDPLSDKNTTAQVNPFLFTTKLFQEAQRAGVSFIRGQAVSLNEATKTLTICDVSHNKDTQVPVDKLIITSGPWSGRVAKNLLGINLPITYLPGHSILIRPSEPLPPQAVFCQISGTNMTHGPELFVWADGLVYVAGENTGPPLPDGTDSVILNPAAIEKLVNASKEISPFLARGSVEVQQLCYRPITPNGVPFIGKLRDGPVETFVAAGHGPWGITLGPGTGMVMTELILDGHAKSADISELDPLMSTEAYLGGNIS